MTENTERVPLTMTKEMLGWIRRDISHCGKCYGTTKVECYRDADETCMECQSKQLLLVELDATRLALKTAEEAKIETAKEGFRAIQDNINTQAQNQELQRQLQLANAEIGMAAERYKRLEHRTQTAEEALAEMQSKIRKPETTAEPF